MTKIFSVKYFFNKLRKMRLTISSVKGYRTIDELLMDQVRGVELASVNSKQGREYEM